MRDRKPKISESPNFLKEWDYENNHEVKPESITLGSCKKVYWKCAVCGHHWPAAPKDRLHGNGCPQCAITNLRKKRIQEKGSFASNYPEKALDWDYEKNGNLLPNQVLAGSNEYVYWKCHKCEHEWYSKICTMVKSTYGCIECAKKEWSLKRFGTEPITITHPHLVEEWEWSENGELTPDDITAHDTRTHIHWICPKGHQWTKTASYRINYKAGCPICGQEKHTSFPEQAIFYYFRPIVHTESRYIYKGMEIDIYFPDFKLAVEYDGIHYHSSEKALQREQKKNLKLASEGISLLRIKESNENRIVGNTIYITPSKNYDSLSFAIQHILNVLHISRDIDMDLERDRISIYNLYITQEKENSICVTHPNVAKQWDSEKNGRINPEYIRSTSNKKFYWRCENNHSWSATVYSRCKGHGCPYCLGKKVIEGENDLQSQNPSLALEWNYEKNGNLKPNEITVNNPKRVYWKCAVCGYEWLTSVANRNTGTGCPKCADKQRTNTKRATIVKKKGSFAEKYPKLMKEWDTEKNAGIDPYKLPSGAHIEVYWICPICNHSWPALINNRVKGRGCPECYKRENGFNQQKRAVEKKGPFTISHPHLVLDWSDKNDRNPNEFTAGSGYRAIWKCHHCGYEWPSPIFKRTGGHKCPKCHK